MRELTLSEVEVVSGGLLTPLDMAIYGAMGLGILGGGISTAGLTYSLAASGSGAQALGGGMLVACVVGSAINLGAGVFVASMIIAGYLGSAYEDTPFTHVCG